MFSDGCLNYDTVNIKGVSVALDGWIIKLSAIQIIWTHSNPLQNY